jgi:cytochrome P450
MGNPQARLPALDIDFYDPPIALDPYPHYERARALGPVFWNDRLGAWMTTTFAAMRQVHSDTANFSNGTPRIAKIWGDRVITVMDGPVHQAIRKAWQPPFMRSAVAKLSEDMSSLADELLRDSVAALSRGETIDLWPAIRRFPSIVVGKLLGVSAERTPDFIRLSDEVADRVAAPLAADDPTEIRRGKALLDLGNLILDEVRRRETEPSDDLIGKLMAADVAKDLSADDLMRNCRFLLFAGNETTVRWITGTLNVLREHPEVLEAVIEDRSLLPKVLEESLRYETVAQSDFKTAITDQAFIGNVHIPKGDEIYVLLGAANRDPAQFPDPNVFNIHRDTKSQAAFGYGLHICLGMHLARVEAAAFLDQLFDRVPDLEIVRVNHGTPWLFRGVIELWARKRSLSRHPSMNVTA